MNSPHRRAPKPLTPQRLENAALFYMGRFSTSSGNLRRVLLRRVARAEGLEPEQRAQFVEVIDGLIEKFAGQGYLDDAAYVEGRVASLRRQGASSRGIAMKLKIKGAERETIANALQQDESTDAEAALVFARRKRLGPYREVAKRAEFRKKDMAAMGRAGFDYSTAWGVIDGEPVND